MTFASRSVAVHLARGVVGAAALAVAALGGLGHPIGVVVSLGVALVALRGCPMCWTLGLVQTVVAAIRRRAVARSISCGCAPTTGDDARRPGQSGSAAVRAPGEDEQRRGRARAEVGKGGDALHSSGLLRQLPDGMTARAPSAPRSAT